MKCKIEQISPAIAARYLEANRHNRKCSLGFTVPQYAASMKSGHWLLTHQGIAFDENGALIDGQHRLEAVVLSGVTVEMLVCRDLATEVAGLIDTGKSRSAADTFELGGSEIPRRDIPVVIALWRVFVGQTRGTAIDPTSSMGGPDGCDRDTLMAFAEVHAEAIEFSRESLGSGKKGFGHSAVRAAIAAAWWTQDRGRLAQFTAQLKSGVMGEPGDVAVVKLRDWLRTSPLNGTSGRAGKDSVYLRTCNAIHAFIARREIKSLRVNKDVDFVLPKTPGFKTRSEILKAA